MAHKIPTRSLFQCGSVHFLFRYRYIIPIWSYILLHMLGILARFSKKTSRVSDTKSQGLSQSFGLGYVGLGFRGL